MKTGVYVDSYSVPFVSKNNFFTHEPVPYPVIEIHLMPYTQPNPDFSYPFQPNLYVCICLAWRKFSLGLKFGQLAKFSFF